jgi:DNA-binding transcriptional ArsR family regulator
VTVPRTVNPPEHTGVATTLDHDEAERLADVFRLLGEPTRMRILFTLLDAGELCVGDLAATVDASETSVSHALRLLRTTGIVRNRRDGRHVRYRLDDDHVRQLLELTRTHLSHGGTDDG